MSRKALLLRAIFFAAIPVVAFFYPFAFNGPILCAFRRLTGIPCPGCGMTRAFVSIAHGRLIDSLGYNPFGIILFAIILLLFLVTVSDLLFGSDYYRRLTSHKPLTRAVVGVFLFFAAVRFLMFLSLGGEEIIRRESWLYHGVRWFASVIHLTGGS